MAVGEFRAVPERDDAVRILDQNHLEFKDHRTW